MSYIGLTEGNKTVYYEAGQVLGLKAAKEYCTVYLADATQPDGYCTRLVCGCLKLYETKLKKRGFKRVNRFWITARHNVYSLGKDNVIELRIKICKVLKLTPNLRQGFKKWMELALVPLAQLESFIEILFGFVG